ncbi:large neutral amino acids transporter small subunit 1 [Xylariaceae sp. FL0804]|nr:large neutral amino acids transporter small subunit 1 [Xylariaceae sp. FL0804]
MSATPSAAMASHATSSEEPAFSDSSALIRTPDDGMGQSQGQQRLGPPSLTRANGLALVISLQIGSGIFSAPSQISQHVGSPAAGLAVWAGAGLLVWTGAASFIELGVRVPRNGGIQEYLRTCWGEFMGYLFTWTWVVLVKPAANALIANIFAHYLLEALWPLDPVSPWAIRIGGVGCITTLTFLNCLGAAAGAKMANLFLLLKISALGTIIIVGFVVSLFGHGDGVPASGTGWFGWDRSPSDELSLWAWLGNSATAVFGALFCYGGWETAGFVVGDMVNPARDLPVVINGAMTIVIIGFFLTNAALYVCLPFEVMRQSSTVVVEFARRTLGDWGGLVFSLVVAASASGALNANVFATAKLCVAAAQRGYFPAVLANLHCSDARDEAAYFRQVVPWLFRFPVRCFARLTRRVRWEQSVPIFALSMNGALASLFVVIGSFNGLITFVGLSQYFFYLMSVLGIFVLRKADKDQPTGTPPRYQTWIGNPIIFATISAVLVVRGVLSEPFQGLAILSVGLLGLALFYRRFGPGGFGTPAHV